MDLDIHKNIEGNKTERDDIIMKQANLIKETKSKRVKRKAIILIASAIFFSTSIASVSMASEAATGPALEIEKASTSSETNAANMEDAANTADTSNGVSAAVEQVYNGDVNNLKAAKDATQLIVVVGNKQDPAKSRLDWYKRGTDGKLVQVMSKEAVSGMNGITTEKQEGDKKTPAGVYTFAGAFGLKENPGTILTYHRIVTGDYYVDDPASKYYNQLVNTKQVAKDWNSAEDLMRQSPQYNYGLIIDYNSERTPGKGSAIFLHCPKSWNNTGTSGCISIPEEDMKKVICEVDAGTKIVIVQEESDLSNY